MKRPLSVRAVFFAAALVLFAVAPETRAETQIVNGVAFECTEDGLCRPADAGSPAAATNSSGSAVAPARLAHGYMSAAEFTDFLEGRARADPLRGAGLLLTLLLVLVGGLAMNLTPCVLPMIPVNLMIIGKSPRRALAYGAGIASAYGALGLAAALGGMSFGAVQSHPVFNFAVAAVFAALGLALCGVWTIDFAKYRFKAGAFLMGALSAVLAGACVAPVVVSVLLLTADLFARGHRTAVGLPFVLGLGMALPWPLLGAGMRVLPKPGAWMKWVNRVFAVVVFGFSAHYAALGAGGLGRARTAPGDVTPATFSLDGLKRPVLVDCWASWCKNCAAMDKVMETPEVKFALRRFTVVRLRAEDLGELRRRSEFSGVKGLPAFAVFESEIPKP